MLRQTSHERVAMDARNNLSCDWPKWRVLRRNITIVHLLFYQMPLQIVRQRVVDKLVEKL